MSGRFLHYSAKPLGELRSVEQRPEPDMKPRGLWFSVEGEDDWKSWCESEDFHTVGLAHEHEVVLHPEAAILRLSNPLDVDVFTERFGVRRYGHSMYIKWGDVATEYQGIIIAPYIWERRMTDHTFWYYGWDCASGCVWDAAAIQSVRAARLSSDKASRRG